MLPLKWKIFRIVNYMYIAINTLIIGRVLYINWSTFLLEGFVLLNIVFTSCFILLVANSILNLYLLEKHYPCTLPGRPIQSTSSILLVLSAIFLSMITVVFSGLTAEFFYNKIHKNNSSDDLLYLVALGLLLAIGSFILWNQVILRKTIRRNRIAFLDNFLKNDKT